MGQTEALRVRRLLVFAVEVISRRAQRVALEGLAAGQTAHGGRVVEVPGGHVAQQFVHGLAGSKGTQTDPPAALGTSRCNAAGPLFQLLLLDVCNYFLLTRVLTMIVVICEDDDDNDADIYLITCDQE